MSSAIPLQDYHLLEKSNKGRKSKVDEKIFLSLIAKHFKAFKSNGRMLPLKHEIITEFSETLQFSRKGIYLKIDRYLKVINGYCLNDESNDSEKEDDDGLTDERYKKHTFLLSSEYRNKLMPIKRKRLQMPDNWTFFIAELMWDCGIKTACAYSFINGNIVDGELNTKAYCCECNASFNIYSDQNFKKIHIFWIKKGNENIIHVKKRKFTKNIKFENAKALTSTSSMCYNRQKAAEKMIPGDVIPATIANTGTNIYT